MTIIACGHCGAQTIVTGDPDDTCIFCSRPPERQEVKKVVNKGSRRQEYFEQHKEEIIEDYNTMTLIAFYDRWHISTVKWIELKKLWGVEGKRKPKVNSQIEPQFNAVPDAHKLDIKPPKDTAPLTEHEHFLLLLGWQQAIRELLGEVRRGENL